MRFWSAPSKLAILTLTFIAYSALDICMLELVMKPIAAHCSVSLEYFDRTYFGITTIVWHFFYVPCGVVLLGFAGYAVHKWRGAIVAVILFATGYEDWCYYLLQGRLVPAELPWLDQQPGVTWTRLIFWDSPHVSFPGMVLATSLGIGIALWLLRKKSRE